MAVLVLPVVLAVSAVPTDGRVGAAGGIVRERKVTSGSVGATAVVKDKCAGSNRGVLCAGGVEQKRCHTHRGIGICVVEGQRSAANTSIEAAGGIYKERPPTKRCISGAGCEGIKRVATFRCREIGKAPVRRWTDLPARLAKARSRLTPAGWPSISYFDFSSFLISFRCFEKFQGLFTITLGAGLRISSWALTFWICAACSFNWVVSVSICCCCCVTVACKF